MICICSHNKEVHSKHDDACFKCMDIVKNDPLKYGPMCFHKFKLDNLKYLEKVYGEKKS